MKNLFILLLILPAICIGQKKGDNTVIIKDPAITINILKKELIKRGFPIDKSDSNYVSTEYISPKDWYAMKFSALKEADSIILKSWFKEIRYSAHSSFEARPANYSGLGGSENKMTFKALVSFANSLSQNAYCIRQ